MHTANINSSVEGIAGGSSVTRILVPWIWILRALGYGNFHRLPRRRTAFAAVGHALLVTWSVWLMVVNLLVTAGFFYDKARNQTRTMDSTLTMVGQIQGQTVFMVGIPYLMIIFRKYLLVVSELDTTYMPVVLQLVTNTRRNIILIVVFLSTYNVGLGLFWGQRYLIGFPEGGFPANSLRGMLCEVAQNCRNHSWMTTLTNTATGLATLCMPLIELGFILIHSFILVVCYMFGLSFKSVVIQLTDHCKRNMFQSVVQDMKKHAALEEFVQRFDEILSKCALMLYSYNVLLFVSLQQHLQREVNSWAWAIQMCLELAMRTVSFIYVNEQGSRACRILQRFLANGDKLTMEQRDIVTTHMRRLTGDPVGISLAGIIIVDRKFIASLVGLIFTYLLVVWQLGEGNSSGSRECTEWKVEEVVRMCFARLPSNRSVLV